MIQRIRELNWFLRQWRKAYPGPRRPVLDAIDFGNGRCNILDIGANVGGFSANMLLRAPLAQIYAFEPNPEIYSALKKNAMGFGQYRGSPRCIPIAKAVGSCDEKRQLRVTKFHAASSLLPVSRESREGWPDVDFSETANEAIDVISIDTFMSENNVREVKLIKLDVQGFELEALKGAARSLKNVEYIVAEVQFCQLYEGSPLWPEITSYLLGFGFEPVLMDGFCFDREGKPLQADMLYHRPR